MKMWENLRAARISQRPLLELSASQILLRLGIQSDSLHPKADKNQLGHSTAHLELCVYF